MAKKQEVVKSVTYYAPYSKQAFSVPVRGEDGKLVALKDNQGNQKYHKGYPQWQTKYMEFQTQVAVRTNSSEPLCFFRVDFFEKLDAEGKLMLDADKNPILVPENQDVYDALEKLADDPGTKIEREESYKKKANPEAFEKEQELKAAKAENAKLKKQKAEKEDAVTEMLKENERLKAELSQAKGGNKANTNERR
jgi:hypothetical protein